MNIFFIDTNNVKYYLYSFIYGGNLDNTSEDRILEISRMVEAVLMTSELPVGVEKLKNIIDDAQIREIKTAVTFLNDFYDSTKRSFHILEIAGGYQMYTRPQYAELVSKLDRTRESRLTQSALETLAVVAYRQPVTKAEIEKIRGVSCDSPVKTLLERNLIHAAGRADSPGKPTLYSTTKEFLRFFQLNSVEDLPSMDEIAAQS